MAYSPTAAFDPPRPDTILKIRAEINHEACLHPGGIAGGYRNHCNRLQLYYLPVLQRDPKAMAKRAVCLNNLKQINMGLRMYADDSSDKAPRTPGTTASPGLNWSGYKNLMKNYVGAGNDSSTRDRLFACPADTFHYNLAGNFEYVPKGTHEEAPDFMSYGFNGGNARTNSNAPGIAGRTLIPVKITQSRFRSKEERRHGILTPGTNQNLTRQTARRCSMTRRMWSVSWMATSVISKCIGGEIIRRGHSRCITTRPPDTITNGAETEWRAERFSLAPVQSSG